MGEKAQILIATNLCLRKFLQNIIVNHLESRTEPAPISLTGKQRTMICSLSKQLSEPELTELVKTPDKIAEIITILEPITADTTDATFKTIMVVKALETIIKYR